ncbi:hypothetical protein [Lacticaseibacillus manihotivorans]|uniref:Uncharacterized protein n=1 Tax=Lacticaseibacillus manihotivorans TaxID=88233 RepID=A0A5P8JU42_9LACO|nr:hypothetical protein [Lacticaseibacillus manihotivorans]QFQ92546.1 hypothetical protein LM010_14635 [Lacticaseibacillus manihotivorans]
MKISIQELVKQVNDLPIIDVTTNENGQYWSVNFVSEALAGGSFCLETGRSVLDEEYDISNLDTVVNEDAAYLIDYSANSVYSAAGTTFEQLVATLESFFAHSVYVNDDGWYHTLMPTPLAKALVQFGDGLVQEFIHANY